MVRKTRRGAGLMDLARKGMKLAREHDLDEEGDAPADPKKMMEQMGPAMDMMIKMKQAGITPPPQGGRRSRRTRRRARKSKKSSR
jgi:hypothetical protein